MHLRDATERIRVLHVLLGLGYQFATRKQPAEILARLNLSAVRAYLLDAVHKRVDAAVEGFERQGGYQVGTV